MERVVTVVELEADSPGDPASIPGFRKYQRNCRKTFTVVYTF